MAIALEETAVGMHTSSRYVAGGVVALAAWATDADISTKSLRIKVMRPLPQRQPQQVAASQPLRTNALYAM